MNGDNSPDSARPDKHWFGQVLRAFGIGNEKEKSSGQSNDQSHSSEQNARKPAPATEKDRLRQIRDKYDNGRITQTDLHALASQQHLHATGETVVRWTHRDEDKHEPYRPDSVAAADQKHVFSVDPQQRMPLPEQAADLVQAWAQRISTPPIPGAERPQTPGIPINPPQASPVRTQFPATPDSSYPWSGPSMPSARPDSIPVIDRPRVRGIADHSYRNDEAEFEEPRCRHTNGAEISSTSLPKLNGEGRPATRFVLNKRRLGSITLTLAACEPVPSHESEAEKQTTAALDPRTELADEWKCEVSSTLTQTVDEPLAPRPAPPPAMRPLPNAQPAMREMLAAATSPAAPESAPTQESLPPAPAASSATGAETAATVGPVQPVAPNLNHTLAPQEPEPATWISPEWQPAPPPQSSEETQAKIPPGRPPAPYSMCAQKEVAQTEPVRTQESSVPSNYTVEEPPVEFTKPPLTQFKCYIPVDSNRPGGGNIVGPTIRAAHDNRTDTTDIPSRPNPFAHFSEASLRLLAESPNTAPGTLMWLACHYSPDIRASVARNGRTPMETIWLLAKDDEPGVRLSIAENAQSSPSVLQVLSEDNNQLVAWRANNTLKLLQLGKQEMEQFKLDQTVAELSSTEYDDREAAQSSDETIYHLQPGDIVDLDPPPAEQLDQPAAQPDTTDETLLAFLTLIAHKASTPQRRLYELARHPNLEVRAAVATNDNASLEIMWLLSRDRDKEVREKLLENCNCPLEILEALQEDVDQFIAWSARAILTRLLSGQPVTDHPRDHQDTPRMHKTTNP